MLEGEENTCHAPSFNKATDTVNDRNCLRRMIVPKNKMLSDLGAEIINVGLKNIFIIEQRKSYSQSIRLFMQNKNTPQYILLP
jgi:hypothetical protein